METRITQMTRIKFPAYGADDKYPQTSAEAIGGICEKDLRVSAGNNGYLLETIKKLQTLLLGACGPGKNRTCI